MTLGELIEKLGGKLVHGSAATDLAGVADSHAATSDHLVFAEDAASAARALAGSAGALVLKPKCLESRAANSTIAIVEADQPRLWFAKAAKLLKPAPEDPLLPQPHHMGSHVKLGKDVSSGRALSSARTLKSALEPASKQVQSSAKASSSAKIAASIRAPSSIPERPSAIA